MFDSWITYNVNRLSSFANSAGRSVRALLPKSLNCKLKHEKCSKGMYIQIGQPAEFAKAARYTDNVVVIKMTT